MACPSHGGAPCWPGGSEEHTGATTASSQSFPRALPRHQAEGGDTVLLQAMKGRTDHLAASPGQAVTPRGHGGETESPRAEWFAPAPVWAPGPRPPHTRISDHTARGVPWVPAIHS